MQVILSPQPQLTDLPLKSYYRYALPTFAAVEKVDGGLGDKGEEEEDEEKGLLGQPMPAAATFAGLPGASDCTGPVQVTSSRLWGPSLTQTCCSRLPPAGCCVQMHPRAAAQSTHRSVKIQHDS